MPEYHRRVPNILSAISGIGAIFVIWGVATIAIWPTILGVALVYLGKLWFIDRMVWLYENTKAATREYTRWLY